MDRLHKIEERLKALEVRQGRAADHFLNVMASQRERTEKAFDEAKLALLEMQVAMRASATAQETALKSYVEETNHGLAALREAVQELTQDLTSWRSEVEQRLARLERDRPPAA